MILEAEYRLLGRDNYVTKNHTHNAIELIECIHGEGTVLKSDRSYPLQNRMLYLIDARRPHVVYPLDSERYRRNKIVLEADAFERFCHEIGLGDTLNRLLTEPPLSTDAHPEIDRLFETVATLFNNNDAMSRGYACGYIVELLHRFVLGRQADVATTVDSTVGKILHVIAETDGLLTLGGIAERLHMNKYYLCHLFRNRTGMTLTEYLSERQYEKSCRLLRETDDSIETVALRCGFATSSSFTRFFKKKSGMAPRVYRQSAVKTVSSLLPTTV
ncbi:MAG: helix-turn-helix domain-containing protein [Ruminococcaceae bacterium]|nr:helix-turn-helix domain-containing protein [Oscillospiraceae bacterium]